MSQRPGTARDRGAQGVARDTTGIDGDCDRVPAVDLAQVAATTFDDLVGNDLCKTTILDTLVHPVRMPPSAPRARAPARAAKHGQDAPRQGHGARAQPHPATLRVLFLRPRATLSRESTSARRRPTSFGFFAAPRKRRRRCRLSSKGRVC